MRDPVTDLAAEAESAPHERARRTSLVRSRFRAVGLSLYPEAYAEAMVQLIEDECVAIRKRFAAMLDVTREYYAGQGMTDAQLERAAYTLLVHYIDHDGAIALPMDSDTE